MRSSQRNEHIRSKEAGGEPVTEDTHLTRMSSVSTSGATVVTKIFSILLMRMSMCVCTENLRSEIRSCFFTDLLIQAPKQIQIDNLASPQPCPPKQTHNHHAVFESHSLENASRHVRKHTIVDECCTQKQTHTLTHEFNKLIVIYVEVTLSLSTHA